jgi:ferredoxin-NADP reductase
MLTQPASPGLARRVARILDTAATPHGLDSYLELVVPTWSTSEVRGRVTGVRRQTANTVTLTIAANRNWAGFQAGQYTQLSVEIDGIRHTRCYSMAHTASGRSGRGVELTIKAQPGGIVSSHLVAKAQVGMIVGLTPARGDFVLPGRPGRRPGRLLLVGGGSGITPVMSMLRTLCAEGHAGPVTFVHYCLTAADQTYGPELDALASVHANVRVVRIYTDEPGAGDLDGFASESQLDAIQPRWGETETFLCGPAPLMASMAAIYGRVGASERLHTEAFTLTEWVAEAGDVAGALAFGPGCPTVTNDGRPILEQAEGAGLQPQSGCRMGICHTCACPLVRGSVRNVVTGEVTTGPDAGDIRLCVSVPVGDVQIDL